MKRLIVFAVLMFYAGTAFAGIASVRCVTKERVRFVASADVCKKMGGTVVKASAAKNV